MSKYEYFKVMKSRNFRWKEGTIIKGWTNVAGNYILGDYSTYKSERDEFLKKGYIIRVSRKELIESFLRSII